MNFLSKNIQRNCRIIKNKTLLLCLLFRTDFNSLNPFSPANINQQMLQDLSSTPLLDNSDMTFDLNGIQKSFMLLTIGFQKFLKY